MKKLGFGLSIIIAAGLLFACGNKTVSEYPGYDKIENGLFIKKLKENKEGRAANVGDIITLNMMYSTSDDSLLFDSKQGAQPVQLRADTGKYEGDLIGAFVGMHEGDSAMLLTSADSFFLKVIGMPEVPEYIDSASMLTFTVNVLKVQTLEELQAEANAKNAQMEVAEGQILQQYLADNNITTQPTESGLIFISKKKGTGKQAAAGKKVQVHYEGMLLDGTYFDTSVEEVAREQGLYNEARAPYAPFEFTLGQGQVIKGWDEGIAMLKEGGKARLIIPSSIAYGANPRPGGPIQPFSTLIFDVELIKVMD